MLPLTAQTMTQPDQGHLLNYYPPPISNMGFGLVLVMGHKVELEKLNNFLNCMLYVNALVEVISENNSV